jgi:hypothetical protein
LLTTHTAEATQRDYDDLLARALREPGVTAAIEMYEAVERAGGMPPEPSQWLMADVSTNVRRVRRR